MMEAEQIRGVADLMAMGLLILVLSISSVWQAVFVCYPGMAAAIVSVCWTGSGRVDTGMTNLVL